MSQKTEELWTILHEAGVVEGDIPQIENPDSPWYVKVMLAFSGWLAALFLLGFIAIGFEFIIENTVISFFIGALMIGGAFKLLQSPNNEFIEHLAFAISLAGQALVVFSFFDITRFGDEGVWCLVLLLETILAFCMPNFVHRVFSSAIATASLYMVLNGWGLPVLFVSIIMLLASWVWLNEFRFLKHLGRLRAIGYGLVLAVIPLKGTALFGYAGMGWSSYSKSELWAYPWLEESILAMVMIYILWHLIQRINHQVSIPVKSALLLTIPIVCLLSAEAPGFSVGLMIMLLGFAGSNRVLLGLGIASLLFFISSYYYLLDVTLLVKSQTLLMTGLILLAVRWCVLRFSTIKLEVPRV